MASKDVRRVTFLILTLSCDALLCQEDERHEQAGDVRAQLRFFEQLDQMEKQRKEEQEREILLKAAKVTTGVSLVHMLTLGGGQIESPRDAGNELV